MFEFEIIPELRKKLAKLSTKNKPLYEQTMQKISEITGSSTIEHYKNLRHNMKDKKRVHIGHFVLTFKYIQEENKIKFVDFDHHDIIYKRR